MTPRSVCVLMKEREREMLGTHSGTPEEMILKPVVCISSFWMLNVRSPPNKLEMSLLVEPNR